jgi:predicted dehydrogenase
MAISFSECQEILEAGKKFDIPIFTAYYRRALPKFLKVKSIIELGLIGEMRAVNMRLYKNFADGNHQAVNNWRIDPRIAGAGYFFDLGSHMIDLIQYYFGSIEDAKGIFSNQTKQ